VTIFAVLAMPLLLSQGMKDATTMQYETLVEGELHFVFDCPSYHNLEMYL